MEESPRYCSHLWAEYSPNRYPGRYISPIIGYGPREMHPGAIYQCINCRARLFIKHRGTLIFATTNTYSVPSLFAASCICGVRYPKYGFLPGHQGREYVLSHMNVHVQNCNRSKI